MGGVVAVGQLVGFPSSSSGLKAANPCPLIPEDQVPCDS